MDSYLEAIESFLFDEKQIVTYKWLSRKLSLHNSAAKDALAKYIEDPKRKEKCTIVYLVTGKTPDGLSVILVPEYDLTNVEAEFENVFGRHVYSIQEHKPRVDLNVLYDADKLVDTVPEAELRSVRYSKNNLMKCEKLISENAANQNDDEKQKETASDILAVPTTKKIAKDTNKPEQSPDNQNKTSALKKKPALFSMWGKKSTKMDSESETLNKPTVETVNSDNEKSNTVVRGSNDVVKRSLEKQSVPPSTSKSTVAVMFDKQKSKLNTTKATKENGALLETSNSQSLEKQSVPPSTSKSTVAVKLNTTKETKENGALIETSNSQNTRENGINNNNNNAPLKCNDNKTKKKKHTERGRDKIPAKKMKRIIMMNDSDSSEENRSDVEMFSDEPEADPVESSKVEESADVVNNDVIDSNVNKRVRRKVIDKTVMGEDGYFYTKKEVVYESCDEAELDENDKQIERIEVKKLETDISASKEVHQRVKQQVKLKNKQSSIMSFLGKPPVSKKK